MSTMRSLWLRWKSLRLPWRKRFLVGSDLIGNTYWEAKDALNSNRMRRIAQGPRNQHHGDVQISPQWHQWLRHTRYDPPSMEEQQMDVARQIQLKQNAMLADQRWASKKKLIEKPAEQKEPQRFTFAGNPEVGEGQETIEGGDAPKTEPAHKEGVRNAVADPWEQERQKQREKTSNPSGAWQPEAWTPGASKR